MTFFSLSFALFLILDPLGNLPVFASILRRYEPKKQYEILLRELLFSLALLILFQFAGEWVLKHLSISIPAVRISGGIILFLIALGMIFPSLKTSGEKDLSQEEPFIVPLSVPLIAGPSILAVIMAYSPQYPYVFLLGAIAVSWLASFIILILTPLLAKVLKEKIMTACTRLMGLILTFIAINMLLEGLTTFLKIN